MFCSICNGRDVNVVDIPPPYRWIQRVECKSGDCCFVNHYCSLCRCPLTDDKGIKRHLSTKTHLANLGNMDSSNLLSDGKTYERIDLVTEGMHDGNHAGLPNNSNGFNRAESNIFFDMYFRGDGDKYLVTKATQHLNNVNDNLSMDEVNLHLQICELSYALSREQRKKLSSVLNLAEKHTEKRMLQFGRKSKIARDDCPLPNPYTSGPSSNLPTTIQEIRSLYLEGKHAIVPNLAHPSVEIVGGHSYISIIEIVREMLAIGLNFDPKVFLRSDSDDDELNVSVQSPYESTRYRAIHERASLCEQNEHINNILVLGVNTWSDDFDPNNTKSNRGSVWIMTVTVVCPQESRNDMKYTYPIAIGQKEDDHSLVLEKFGAELAQLSTHTSNSLNCFFHGKWKCHVRVYAELFVTLQDQPERRKTNDLTAGNSTYHARWGWSLDTNKVVKFLPACTSCQTIMMNHDDNSSMWYPDTNCMNCVNWTYNISSSLLHTEAEDDYPLEELNTNGQLQPLKLTYHILRAAVEKARINVESKAWSQTVAESFLRVHCIPKEMGSKLLDAATVRSSLKDIETEDEEEIRRWYHASPEMMQNIDLPVMWKGNIYLHQHIDAPMHLLFLGIEKAIMRTVVEWTKQKSKYTAFLKGIGGVLEAIPSVSWCTTAPFTGDKLGGWVSENYLALARLGNWLFCALPNIMSDNGKDDEEYTLPNIHHTKWVRAMCTKWIRAHAITLQAFVESNILKDGDLFLQECIKLHEAKTAISKLKVDVLRSIIGSYLGSTNPPVLVRNRVCSVTTILSLISSLQEMISSIMAPSATAMSIRNIDKKIRIFLTIFAGVDTTMNPNGRPAWLSKYNFLCLLNLPAIIEEFGPVRNLWEGSSQGEGFIRSLKPLIGGGLRTRWQVSVMERMLRLKALNSLVRDVKMKVSNQEEAEFEIRSAVVYDSLYHFESEMRQGKPISCVRLCNNSLAVLLVGKLYVNLLRGEFSVKNNNSCYHEWMLDICHELAAFDPTNVLSNLILLPLLTPTGLPRYANPCGVYTAICSDWETICFNAE